MKGLMAYGMFLLSVPFLVTEAAVTLIAYFVFLS